MTREICLIVKKLDRYAQQTGTFPTSIRSFNAMMKKALKPQERETITEWACDHPVEAWSVYNQYV